LGELGLTVRPQVFVPETAHDLVVAVESGDHEQLFEQLGRLRQGVELAGIDAAGHEIVPGAFGGAAGQEGGLDIEKSVGVQVLPYRRGGLVPRKMMLR
jgi:hypothetical protein